MHYAEDPFFILGDYKCTLFAHASGVLQFLKGERAWARINAAERINYVDNVATIAIIKEKKLRKYLTSLVSIR